GPAAPEDVRRTAGGLTGETVVEVEGEVVARPGNMKNPELATGDVEVHPSKLTVVGLAVTPAIPVARAKGEELPSEELRLKHRHPEFTQIDLEASFVGPEDVLGFVEAVLVALWDEAGQQVAGPFPRITWREAMERYGTDKPDLRYELAITDWTTQVGPLGVPFFDAALKNGARVRGLAVKGGGGTLSRKDVDQLAEATKQLGGAGLAWVKRQGEQISGSVGKYFTAGTRGALGIGDGDAALIAAG